MHMEATIVKDLCNGLFSIVLKVHFSHRVILTSHDTSQAPISGAKTTAKNNVQILDGIDELWDSLM